MLLEQRPSKNPSSLIPRGKRKSDSWFFRTEILNPFAHFWEHIWFLHIEYHHIFVTFDFKTCVMILQLLYWFYYQYIQVKLSGNNSSLIKIYCLKVFSDENRLDNLKFIVLHRRNSTTDTFALARQVSKKILATPPGHSAPTGSGRPASFSKVEDVSWNMYV